MRSQARSMVSKAARALAVSADSLAERVARAVAELGHLDHDASAKAALTSDEADALSQILSAGGRAAILQMNEDELVDLANQVWLLFDSLSATG